MEFRFPDATVDLEEVRSSQELREKLEAQRLLLEIGKASVRYRMAAQKDKYLYARCCWKRCPACLKYKWMGSSYQLRSAVN